MIELEIAVRQRLAPGETVCGDGAVVLEHGGFTIIGLADGLGHGPRAHEASTAFCEAVRDSKASSIHEMILSAHQRMRGTRGAAATLIRVDRARQSFEFVGIGNVDARLHSAAELRPVLTRGTLGARLPTFRKQEYPCQPGDVMIMFTDGISNRFDLSSVREDTAEGTAERILFSHGMGHDDASCVTIFFRG